MNEIYRAGMFYISSSMKLSLPLANDVSVVEHFRFDYNEGNRGLIDECYVKKGNGIYTSIDSVLIRHKDVGDIKVTDCGKITFVKSPTFNESCFDQIVSGPLVAALAARRGVTVIHASCAAFQDKAILIVGPSGAGKSTLASYLANEGWSFISDDLVMIEMDGGNAFAWPTVPTSWLWKDSFEVVAKPGSVSYDARNNGKLALPAGSFGSCHSFRIDKIVLPTFDSKSAGVSVNRMLKSDAYKEIKLQLCGISMMSSKQCVQSHKNNIYDLINYTTQYRLSRPRDFSHLPFTARALNNLVLEIQ